MNYPLITFALLTFNQEQFVLEALEGAFSQTYSPLEIIVSDDCSSDHTYEIIQQTISMYKGPHHVVSMRNSSNLGWVAHINRVVAKAQGELIVIAAGDDISLPKRTEAIYDLYVATGHSASSLYSNCYIIDEIGQRHGLLRNKKPNRDELSLNWYATRLAGVIGSTHVWHKRVFEVFGPLDEMIINEDIAITFRSALLGGIQYLHEPLVLYRRHGKNMFFDANHQAGSTPQKLIANQLNYCHSFIALYQTRLHDLDTMISFDPDKEKEYKSLKEDTEANLRDLHQEEKILSSNSKLMKLQIIWRAVIRRVPLRRAARWFFINFFPNLYLALQKVYVMRRRIEI